MSKEFVLALWDDLDRAKGKRVRAARTVRLAYDGEDVELELTELHGDELDQLLAPYLEAGHRPDSDLEPHPRQAKHRFSPGARQWGERIRAFAQATGRPYETSTSTPEHRKYYYSTELREAFAKHEGTFNDDGHRRP